MSDIEECNAVIVGASLSMEDHGLLSGWVQLSYGSGGQGFGGYCLGKPDEPMAAPHCAAWIMGVLRAAGVENWDHLKGRAVRVRREWTKVHAIGHIVEDDRWFTPDEVFRAR